MKKIILLLMLLLASCAKVKEDIISDVVEEEVIEEDVIDIDMAIYSDTVIYAQIVNMMEDIEPYIGKRMRTKGTYRLFKNEILDKYYNVCLVMDSTACCSQGMEFILNDDYKFPDDYPEDGESIMVTGIIDLYEEGNGKYVYLRDATLEKQ